MSNAAEELSEQPGHEDHDDEDDAATSLADELLPDRAKEPTLTLLEYASLRMGLDMLPHRAKEISSKFDLHHRDALARELAAWNRRLATHPSESRELASMKTRMRDFWVRYSRSGDTTPAPPACTPSSSPPPPAAFPPSETRPISSRPSIPPPSSWTEPPPRSTLPSASPFARRISRALEHKDLLAAAMGVAAPPQHSPTLTEHTPPSALPPAEPPLSLERYALLCFAARHLRDRVEALFAANGLGELSTRLRVDQGWQARLRSDAFAYGTFRSHLVRLAQLHGVAWD